MPANPRPRLSRLPKIFYFFSIQDLWQLLIAFFFLGKPSFKNWFIPGLVKKWNIFCFLLILLHSDGAIVIFKFFNDRFFSCLALKRWTIFLRHSQKISLFASPGRVWERCKLVQKLQPSTIITISLTIHLCNLSIYLSIFLSMFLSISLSISLYILLIFTIHFTIHLSI